MQISLQDLHNLVKRTTVLMIFFSMTIMGRAATLFLNGHTDYNIVISSTASVSEITAAKELQYYIKEISGATFPISEERVSNGHSIYIGYSKEVEKIIGKNKPSDTEEGYIIKSIGDNLFILGGKQRGTMYGVFSFLEHFLGVHWYTEYFTKIPKMRSFTFDRINISYSPSLQYRYVQYFHDADKEAEWCAHNKLNMTMFPYKRASIYGGQNVFYGGHSSLAYISSDEYFHKHPEYFAYRDGMRNPKGQICLSNPNVLNIITNKIISDIKAHPDYWCFDVSQGDNQLYCECRKCKEIENNFGGHSGIWIWFVNKISERVRRQYPDKFIGTFAYQYTRNAPKNIRPNDNVIVRLCSYECCFAHPLENCSKNRDFIKDLNDWSKITNNIIVWDYVTDFAQYLAPWPNFKVITPNIRLFQKYNCIGITEEGQYQSHGGEFGELKCWLLAQLLWNPSLNIDSLVHQFIQDYYEEAAPYVEKYYKLCLKQLDGTGHLYILSKMDNYIYSDEFINEGKNLLSVARSACKSKDVISRLEMLEVDMMFCYHRKHFLSSVFNGNFLDMRSILLRHNPYVSEVSTTRAFLIHQYVKIILFSVLFVIVVSSLVFFFIRNRKEGYIWK